MPHACEDARVGLRLPEAQEACRLALSALLGTVLLDVSLDTMLQRLWSSAAAPQEREARPAKPAKPHQELEEQLKQREKLRGFYDLARVRRGVGSSLDAERRRHRQRHRRASAAAPAARDPRILSLACSIPVPTVWIKGLGLKGLV